MPTNQELVNMFGKNFLNSLTEKELNMYRLNPYILKNIHNKSNKKSKPLESLLSNLSVMNKKIHKRPIKKKVKTPSRLLNEQLKSLSLLG